VNTAETGPLFQSILGRDRLGGRLSSRAVARMVKVGAERIGLNPDQFSGHSLRAGFVSSASAAGASEHAIMRQTGHRSSAALQVYMCDSRLLVDNAAALVGL
jgi:integrase